MEKLYAWIAQEPDGGEGVITSHLPGMVGMMPLVGGERALVESYRPHAAMFARVTGYPVRLKVFSAGVIVDEIKRGTYE